MTLVNKLTAIGDAIREKTGGTAELTLDQMVTEIGGITGGGDTSVEDALISHTLTTYSNEDVKKIGQYSFAGSTSLTSVSFPNVTQTEQYAFSGCTNLSTVELPGVFHIGNYCFDHCSALTSISLPEASVIYGGAFSYCLNLENINIPLVIRIDSSAFYSCSKLKKIELTKGCTIQTMAFYNSGLTTLILRYSTGVLNLMGVNAFSGTPIASGTGYIYVPDELVDSYKVATNWVTYANQIKPLSEYVEVS